MSLRGKTQNDYVIAKAVEDKTESDLAAVRTQPKQQHLEVLNVGPEVTSCAVGDRILPFGSEFQAFQFEGEQFIVLRSDQIIHVFEKDAE